MRSHRIRRALLALALLTPLGCGVSESELCASYDRRNFTASAEHTAADRVAVSVAFAPDIGGGLPAVDFTGATGLRGADRVEARTVHGGESSSLELVLAPHPGAREIGAVAHVSCADRAGGTAFADGTRALRVTVTLPEPGQDFRAGPLPVTLEPTP
ncbi:MAG: hypothetical protein ACK4N5_16480, partial [Myxococcales bacterium]